MYVVGMPPPPAQMTIDPASSSVRIAGVPKMRLGSGEGTTRRMLSPSGLNAHPFSACRRAASSAV